MTEGNSPPATPIVEVSPPSLARRPLSAWERFVCVPVGFLWLAALLLLAVPVCAYMTILYFAVRVAQRLAGPDAGKRFGRRSVPPG